MSNKPNLGQPLTSSERFGTSIPGEVSKYGVILLYSSGTWTLRQSRWTSRMTDATPGWIGNSTWVTERHMASYIGQPWRFKSGGCGLLTTFMDTLSRWKILYYGAKSRGRPALIYVNSIRADTGLTDTGEKARLIANMILWRQHIDTWKLHFLYIFILEPHC